jgi:hypothetical protein
MPPVYDIGPLTYNPERGKVELFNFGATNANTTSKGGYCKLWTYDAASNAWSFAVYNSGPKDDSVGASYSWLGDAASKDIDYLWPSGRAAFHVISKNTSGSGRTWLWSGSNWTCTTLFSTLHPLAADYPYWGEWAWTDVNGDGLPDQVRMGWIRNPTNDALSYGPALFLHNGTNLDSRPVWLQGSGYTSPANVPNSPWRLAAGDVTGDGAQDVAVSGSGSDTGNRIVLYAATNGALTTNAIWRSASQQNTVATLGITDVDGDSRPDLAALSHVSGSWTVMVYTNCAGTLTTNAAFAYVLPLDSRSNAPSPSTQSDGSLRWADTDYDRRSELAVAYGYADGAQWVDILKLDGTNLVPVTRLSGVKTPIAFADVDSDRYPDLVGNVSWGSDGWLALFPNVAGTIQSNATWQAEYYEDGPAQLAVGDCDGDGDLELAIGARNVGSVVRCASHMLYRNSGARFDSYPDWQAEEDYGNEFSGTKVVLLDFDGDGILDVVTDKGAYLMDRLLRGRPPLPPRYATAYAGLPGDTGVTIAWDPSPDSNVAAYRIYGRSRLQSAAALIGMVPAGQTSFVDTHPLGLNTYYVSSLDEAGSESRSSATEMIASLPAMRTGGDGRPDYSFSGNPDAGGATFCRTRLGDVNGDGYPDVFGVRHHPSAVTFDDSSWTLWLNTTNGFTLVWDLRWDRQVPGSPVALADVSGDGRDDLALYNERIVDVGGGTNELRAVLDFWASTGNAFDTNSFCTIVFPTNFLSRHPGLGVLAFGDPDGDGDLDMAAAPAGTNMDAFAFLYRNTGGVLAPTPVWTSDVSAVSVLAFGHLSPGPTGALAVATFKGEKDGCATEGGQRVYIYNGCAEGLATNYCWFATNLNAGVTPHPDNSPPNFTDLEASRLDWTDFNHDGFEDLTIFNDFTVYAYTNRGGAITDPGTGATATNYAFLSLHTGDWGNYPGQLLLGWADLDGNGIMDLYGEASVIRDAGAFSGRITHDRLDSWGGLASVFKTGLGTFPEFIEPRWGMIPVWCTGSGVEFGVRTAADFNQDGISDLMMTAGNMIFLGSSNFPAISTPAATNFTVLPSTLICLEGPGATQAVSVIANLNNGTSTDVTATAVFTPRNDYAGVTVFTMTNNLVIAANPSPLNQAAAWIEVVSDVRRGSGGSFALVPRVYVSVGSRPPVPVALRVVPAAPTLARVGEPLDFTVVATMEGGTENDVTPLATFGNSSPSVLALVGAIGLPLQNGFAQVSAGYAGLSATSTVRVSLSTGLASLDLNPGSATIPVGGRQAFEVTARYGDGSSENVTFLSALSSSAPGVAVPVGNTVIGAAQGLAMVTAGYEGVSSLPSRVMVDTMNVVSGAVPTHLEILDIAREQPDVRLDWYCTTPPGATNRFTIYASTNLLDGVGWSPVASNLPRRPLGFSTETVMPDANAPTVYYRVRVDGN